MGLHDGKAVSARRVARSANIKVSGTALCLALAALVSLASAAAAANAAAPCGPGLIRCAAGSPGAGVCVPLVKWCEVDLFRNPYAALPARVADLVPRLTLPQKVNLLQTTPVNNSEVPELGIDRAVAAECLHGYCSRSPSTLFPQSTTLAAAFDPSLVERVATAIATEARAWRNAWRDAGGNSSLEAPPGLQCFSPQINLVRDPRWGRGQETHVRIKPTLPPSANP